MKVSFSVLFIAEAFSVFIEAGVLSDWKWGEKAKQNARNPHLSGSGQFCSQGYCVASSKCSSASKLVVGSCGEWNIEPMVCCISTVDDSSYSTEETVSVSPRTSVSKKYSKPTTSNFIKETTRQTSDNKYAGESHVNTPSLENSLKRNSSDIPTSVNSLAYNKYTTKRPLRNVTHVQLNDPRNRSSIYYSTNMWKNSPVSESRIIFPTEDTWMSKREKQTTQPSKWASQSRSTKPFMWSTRQTPTAAPFGYPTKRMVPKTINPKHFTTPNQTSFPNPTRSNSPSFWESREMSPTKSSWTSKTEKYNAGATTKKLKISNNRPTPTAAPFGYTTTRMVPNKTINPKHFTTPNQTSFSNPTRSKGPSFSESPTRSSWTSKTDKYNARTTTKKFKISNNRSTEPHTSSTRPTPTAAPFKSTTRTIPKTTISKNVNSAKATISSILVDRKNEGRGKTTTRPSVRQPTQRTTKRPTVATRTTNRLRTTPLPNVNDHLCGLKNEPRNRRRQRRDSSSQHKPSKDRLPFARIVGGEEVEPFSWPWVAALYKVTSSGGNRFLSAGSLINENFVLTAAHIFTPEDLRTSSFVVMLGTHDAKDAVAEYLVSSVLRHPRYEQRYYYHDIALLRLQKPVTFNKYVMPVCLPSPDAPLLRDRDLEGKNVTVMGWGDDSFGGKSSRVLKEATFPIVSRISCNTSYVRVASNNFPKGITDDMLCAADPNGGKDACQGDSGGPLTSVENGRHTQVGIVSFGYQCGDKEYPGVYTKVAPYLSWISENARCDEDYGNYYYY